MSDWKAKRFWKQATISENEDGFGVLLDNRPVRTPLKSLLALPTREMARAVTAEWDAQTGEINPLEMPFTRSANAAIDKVTPQHADVAEMLAAYGETDLLCHRAGHPEGLIIQQNKGWNPVLAWLADRYDAPLVSVEGVLPAAQPDASLAALARAVAAFQPFSLTALHDLITLSGSLALALYVADNACDANTAWHLSRIDEDWQISQWGEDEEATEAAEIKRAAFLHAALFLEMSQGA